MTPARRIEPAIPTTDFGRSVEAQVMKTRGEVSILYRTLLNSPVICEGWEKLLTAIRQKAKLSPRLRELIILRIAVLNRAEFEYTDHIPFARKAGVSDAEMEAIKGSDLSSFGALEQLVLRYADTMTRDIQVPDALFDQIAKAFEPMERVELTATIAAYNMVSRFLCALEIH